MAIFTRARKINDAHHGIDPIQLMEQYDLVDATPGKGYIVVAEKAKQLADPGTVDLRELGQSDPSNYSQLVTKDYNSALRGHMGIRQYDEMRRSDGQVRAILRIAKTPVLGARWFIDPASPSKQDIKVAKFVEDCLFRYMSMSWPRLLREILLELDFGWYAFEKVFTIQDGKIVWRKLAPRHPITLVEWIYDAQGGPNGALFGSDSGYEGSVYIPINKLLVFTHDQEAGNLEGISVLRTSYKHWYYKDNLYKIDAIQKERHGIGVPVIKLPPNFSDTDKSLANQMGSNLRTNEKAHIVLPPLWDILMLKMEGNQVDALASAQHHGRLMYESILAGFLLDSSNNEASVDMFNKASRFIADEIRDVFNKWAIPELVNYNWKTVTDYPELKFRRLGDTVDWRTISFAMRNLVGANILKPDDRLEEWIREEMDLPRADPGTVREAATPQAPNSGSSNQKGSPSAPVPGPPRQSTTANMLQAKTASSSRVGNDVSGGK